MHAMQWMIGDKFEILFMAVPAEVVEAFLALRSGDFSGMSALFTLLLPRDRPFAEEFA